MEFFSRLLLVCLLVAVWVLAATAAVPAAPSPGPAGCATMARCGDIDVPYPFALEPQCAIHGDFYLNCTTAVGGTPKLYAFINLEVMNISVQDNKVWIKTWKSRQCYNETNGLIWNNAWMDLRGKPFVLSAEDNKIIVLGCNSLAYLVSDIVSLDSTVRSLYLYTHTYSFS